MSANSTSSLTPPNEPEGPSTYAYKAFISYSHKDEAAARRLHRQLESYRIPKFALLRQGQSAAERHLRPIFRDREDLPASSGLNGLIEEALRESENLIVICSPHAAQSKWVDLEIEMFTRLGRADRIFAVIIGGYPFASRSGSKEIAQTECLPASMRSRNFNDEGGGQNSNEPLAADFRPQGDGEKLGLKKLIAGLLNLRLDKLLQRDLVRARQRMLAVMASAAVIVAALSTLSWLAYSAQQRSDARRADAENFVEFLLSDLSQELEQFGRLDLLDAVGEKAVDYYDQFEDSDFDARANGRRARTMHFMGDLQDKLGQTGRAADYFAQSYDITAKSLAASPNDPTRIFEHGRSAFLKSLPYRRAPKYNEEMACLLEFEALARRLIAAENNSLRSRSELALAKLNIGRVELRLEQFSASGRQLNEAVDLFGGVVTDAPTIENQLNLSESLSWQAEYYRKTGDFKRAYGIRARQAEIMQRQRAAYPDDYRTQEGLVYALLGFGNAATQIANYDEAEETLSTALREIQSSLRREPSREKMMRAQSATLTGLMSAAILSGEFEAYAPLRDQFVAMDKQPEIIAVKESLFWQQLRPQRLAHLDAALEAAKGRSQ